MNQIMKLLIAPLAVFGMLTFTACSGEEQICHEDMPCWDCETMGNLVCGTIVRD